MAIRDRVIMEYNSLTQQHEHIETETFNVDDEYKKMMNEVIDSKRHALDKLEIYLESVLIDSDTRNRIREAPLIEFAYQHTVLRLRTGILQFPWAAVVKDMNPEIDLGEWNATTSTEKARKIVAGALGNNANTRILTVKGVKLGLKDGWETTELEWAENAAVQALPATVALILENCHCLTSLDLRYTLPILSVTH